MRDVMLVEDDELVRPAMVRVLVDAGYRVRATACVADAMAWLAAAPPELVISDLILPGDVSPVLLAQAAAKRGIPLIVASGATRLPARVAAWTVSEVLAKPFTADELLAAVTRAGSPPAGYPSCAGDAASGAINDLSSALEWTPSFA